MTKKTRQLYLYLQREAEKADENTIFHIDIAACCSVAAWHKSAVCKRRHLSERSRPRHKAIERQRHRLRPQRLLSAAQNIEYTILSHLNQ